MDLELQRMWAALMVEHGTRALAKETRWVCHLANRLEECQKASGSSVVVPFAVQLGLCFLDSGYSGSVPEQRAWRLEPKYD